jgi:hypothetical protein
MRYKARREVGSQNRKGQIQMWTGIPYVEDEIKRLATRYLNKLPAHNSDQVRQLNNPLTERRRLKRQWPTDLSLA